MPKTNFTLQSRFQEYSLYSNKILEYIDTWRRRRNFWGFVALKMSFLFHFRLWDDGKTPEKHLKISKNIKKTLKNLLKHKKTPKNHWKSSESPKMVLMFWRVPMTIWRLAKGTNISAKHCLEDDEDSWDDNQRPLSLSEFTGNPQPVLMARLALAHRWICL